MNRVLRYSSLSLAVAALAACGGTEQAAEETPEAVVVAEEAATPAPAPAAGGMEGMEGMQMDPAADPLDAHMAMMGKASGEALTAMIPEHRQLVANTIARMNQEMRDMDMASNTEWNETVEALRGDLVRLPEMTGEELQAFIPEHQARIDKLRELHRGMMADMGM